MRNFVCVLRSSLRYRWTIVGIFVTSTAVALFWGANIGALFPVIKVAVEGKPLQVWLNDDVEQSRQKIVALQQEIASLEAERGQVQDDAQRRRQLKSAQHNLKAETWHLWTSHQLRPLVSLFPRDPFQTIVVVVLMLIGGTAFKGLFVFWNVMLVARLEQRVTFDLRRDFFHQCLRLDQSAFGEHRTSGLLSRFHADISYVVAGVKALFGTALREPLKITSCLILAGLISWRLLLFSLILTPITAFAISKLAGSIKRANRRSLEEFSSLFGVLTEAFQGIETVQAFTLERNQRGKFFSASKACLQKGMRIAFYNAMTKPVTELLGICVIALALLSGAYLTINQETHIFWIRMLDRPIEMELLLVFFGFLIGATEPARKLSDVFNSLQAGMAAADRVLPLLGQTPKIQSPKSPLPMPETMETITFQGVHFHYNADNPVLVDVDLQIQAGETVAIVGPNGCGKTTLVNLLPRFQDPTCGSVRINEVELCNMRLSELRRHIGMVTQRSLLFDDTVYNNILQGRLDASPTDVVRAAQQARADRFINDKLEKGYDTVIGTAGSNLSGGQRQRLALARAMLRDPEILILDEATSQVDLESEQLIHQALEQFARNRTVIIITHRLATLELADRVVVMNHGRIEDVGSHDQLISRCALYQRLHELQFKRSA